MKKTTIATLIALSSLAISAFAGSYSGVDGNGNYYWGNTNRDGSYSGVDGNGNYNWGRVDRSGNYSGVDGNGNYYWGRVNPD